MKILSLNHFPLQGSGSGIYTLNVARELVGAGHQLQVVAPDHRIAQNADFDIRTILFQNDAGTVDGAQVDFNFPCFTTHPQSNTTFYELTDEQLGQYLDVWRQTITEAVAEFQPDVIHAQHVWITPFLANETGVPYFVTCHGTDLIGFPQDKRYRQMALTGAQNAQGVIAISNHIYQEVIDVYGVPAEKVALIGNGFDEKCFHVLPDVTKQDILTKYDISIDSSDIPVVSFVGKFTDFKGIDVLLRAAAQYEQEFPGVQTVIVGQGELWDKLHNLRDELSLRGVNFIGHQNQIAVAEIYNIADVSVVPSRVEAFGLVAIEALACGTPVIATNRGGLPDFINDKVGALVPVDDVNALANAIITELRGKTKQTKGVYAQKYALDKFTWRAKVGEMAQLFAQA